MSRFLNTQCYCGCGRTITFMETPERLFIDFEDSLYNFKYTHKKYKHNIKKEESIFDITLASEDVEDLLCSLAQIYYRMVFSEKVRDNSSRFRFEYTLDDLEYEFSDDNKYYSLDLVKAAKLKPRQYYKYFQVYLSKEQVYSLYKYILKEYAKDPVKDELVRQTKYKPDESQKKELMLDYLDNLNYYIDKVNELNRSMEKLHKKKKLLLEKQEVISE